MTKEEQLKKELRELKAKEDFDKFSKEEKIRVKTLKKQIFLLKHKKAIKIVKKTGKVIGRTGKVIGKTMEVTADVMEKMGKNLSKTKLKKQIKHQSVKSLTAGLPA